MDFNPNGSVNCPESYSCREVKGPIYSLFLFSLSQAVLIAGLRPSRRSSWKRSDYFSLSQSSSSANYSLAQVKKSFLPANLLVWGHIYLFRFESILSFFLEELLIFAKEKKKKYTKQLFETSEFYEKQGLWNSLMVSSVWRQAGPTDLTVESSGTLLLLTDTQKLIHGPKHPARYQSCQLQHSIYLVAT